ncbi:MAG: LPD38 domain-containing protein, partial [Dehalococcoidia bacterium]|nr:LPD38 domain-containing protein [Dehalococcoidia bacterium]
PAFLVVNPMRDAFSAFFREKLVPLSPDYFAGWTAVITKNADFSEAAQSGALLSGLAETFQTTDALKRAQRLGSVQLKSPKDALLIVPRLLEAANIVAEQATRVATFRKLRRQGISQLEAAVRARDATVDFRKAGTTVQAINQMIPFFNAAIQGSVNTARTIRNNPRWAAVAAGAFMVPTVITRLNNQRFETNGLIPDYEYTTNWVIQVADGTRKDGTKFPLYVKVPKGQIASIMTLPGETLFHMARVTEDRSALEVLLQSGLDVAQAVSPVDPSFSGIAPPALQTIAGVSTNRDIFTGQPIVPLREERLAPEQQFGPETSRLAILMGQAAGISPRLLDFA